MCRLVFERAGGNGRGPDKVDPDWRSGSLLGPMGTGTLHVTHSGKRTLSLSNYCRGFLLLIPLAHKQNYLVGKS